MNDRKGPSFETAMKVLPKLLEGKKTPKEIAYEEGLSYTAISQIKQMFPLFLGLPRKYNRSD